MLAWVIYAGAALLEIGGCFAVWAVVRHGRAPAWLLVAALALAGFTFLLSQTGQAFAGRAFAAYGGVYVAASLAWMWVVEQETPTRQDLLGGAIVLIGAWIISSGGRA